MTNGRDVSVARGGFFAGEIEEIDTIKELFEARGLDRGEALRILLKPDLRGTTILHRVGAIPGDIKYLEKLIKRYDVKRDELRELFFNTKSERDCESVLQYATKWENHRTLTFIEKKFKGEMDGRVEVSGPSSSVEAVRRGDFETVVNMGKFG